MGAPDLLAEVAAPRVAEYRWGESPFFGASQSCCFVGWKSVRVCHECYSPGYKGKKCMIHHLKRAIPHAIYNLNFFIFKPFGPECKLIRCAEICHGVFASTLFWQAEHEEDQWGLERGHRQRLGWTIPHGWRGAIWYTDLSTSVECFVLGEVYVRLPIAVLTITDFFWQIGKNKKQITRHSSRAFGTSLKTRDHHLTPCAGSRFVIYLGWSVRTYAGVLAEPCCNSSWICAETEPAEQNCRPIRWVARRVLDPFGGVKGERKGSKNPSHSKSGCFFLKLVIQESASSERIFQLLRTFFFLGGGYFTFEIRMWLDFAGSTFR